MQKLKVVEFSTMKPWKEHKGWNRPAVEVGTLRYAILYVPQGGYFVYSYLSQAQAVAVANRMMTDGVDRDWNLQTHIQDTIPVRVK